MSRSASRLRRGHKHKPEAITSRAAGVGYSFPGNFGLGFTLGKKEAREELPVQIPTTNPVLGGMANYHGALLRSDGTVDVFGQNIGNQSPWSTGPEGSWWGVWQWRGEDPHLEKNLRPQQNLIAEGKTWAQIRTKERNLELEVPGQVIYPVGAVVIWEGITWICEKRHAGVEPPHANEAGELVGGSAGWEAYWKKHPVQIIQFLHPKKIGAPAWSAYYYNITLPVRSPQLKNVASLSSAGSHGICVLKDGTLRSWGRAMRYGVQGTGYEAGWGPAPRPQGEISRFVHEFTGTVTAGSPWIEALSEVGNSHEKGSGKTSYGLATVTGNVLSVEEAGVLTNTPLRSFCEILEAEVEEQLDEEGHPFSPAVNKVIRIKMKSNAAKNYTGKIKVQRGSGEVKIWPAESYNFDVGWPITPILPEKVLGAATLPFNGHLRTETGKLEKVKCVAADTGAGGGSAYSIALTDEGEVLCWGSNEGGQLGNLGATGNEHWATVPQFVKVAGGANMTNIVAIVTGGVHFLALTNDHKVYAWGSLQLGAGGETTLWQEGKSSSSTPTLIPGLPTEAGKRPIAIGANSTTSYVVLEDGTVRAVGGNEHGECGNGIVAGKLNTQWKATKAYSVGDKTSNKGVNYKCILARSITPTPPAEDPEHWEVGTTVEVVKPATVTGLTNVKYIHGKGNHVAAVTTEGKCFTWGENTYGELGNGVSVKAKTGENTGSIQEVNFGGRECWSANCGEFNTLFILNSSTAPEAAIVPKLRPEGSILGEAKAYLDLTWKSTLGTSGWKLVYHRQPTWYEELEINQGIEEINELEAEGWEGLSVLEIEAYKEERTILEEEQEEIEEGGTTINIVPTEISPGKLHFLWEPPEHAFLTKNFGFKLTLYNTNASFKKRYIWTNSLWGSPYGGA